jgi:hypothetical protein
MDLGGAKRARALKGALMATATTTRTDTLSDEQIQRDVLAELKFEPRVTPNEIGVAAKDGIVTLTGSVDSYTKRWAAEHLDLRITPEGLTIRGETRQETEDSRDDYRVVQSRYGSFVRTVPLPPGLDADRAEARVKDGVLTVKLPKVDARPGMRRVPIKA